VFSDGGNVITKSLAERTLLKSNNGMVQATTTRFGHVPFLEVGTSKIQVGGALGFSTLLLALIQGLPFQTARPA
jgi:hypothetical protein